MEIRNKIKWVFSKKSFGEDKDWLRVDIFTENSSRDLHKLSKKDYLNFYKWRCFVAVSTISNAVAQLERQVVDKNWKQINDPMLDLITYDLLVNIVSYMKLNGACYIRKNMVGNKVVSLHVLRPDLVTPVFNKQQTELVSYTYKVNNAERNFDPKEVITIANFNPMLPYPMNYSGLSDVQAIATAIDADYQASKRNRKFFYNNASVNGVLETEQNLAQDSVEKITSKREQKYRWTDNAHKVWVLTGGLKYKPLNPSQKEMDFIESRRFNRDEIMWFFKVPKAIVGLGEGDNALNVRSFQQIFARETVKPIATRIMEAFNDELFGDNVRFEFVNIVPSDLTETRNDWLANGITLNEFRATRNYPPLKDGDKLRHAYIYDMNWTDQEVAELEKAIELPKFSDVKLEKKIGDMITKWIRANTRWTEEYNQKYRENKMARNNKFNEAYMKKLELVFDRQEKEIMAEYKKRYKSQKMFSNTKAKFPLLNMAKRAVMYYEVLKETQKDLVSTEATKALLEVGISEPFNLTDKIEKDLKKNIEKFAGSIDLETNAKLENSFKTILDQWLSVNDGAKLLQNNFVELRTSRAEKIVRTETVRAWNLWSQLWRKQTGVVEKKQRYTALDERVCEFCWPMNWKIVWLEEKYFDANETMVWSDGGKISFDYWSVEYPPLHCNCRCVILPVIE